MGRSFSSGEFEEGVEVIVADVLVSFVPVCDFCLTACTSCNFLLYDAMIFCFLVFFGIELTFLKAFSLYHIDRYL